MYNDNFVSTVQSGPIASSLTRRQITENSFPRLCRVDSLVFPCSNRHTRSTILLPQTNKMCAMIFHEERREDRTPQWPAPGEQHHHYPRQDTEQKAMAVNPVTTAVAGSGVSWRFAATAAVAAAATAAVLLWVRSSSGSSEK